VLATVLAAAGTLTAGTAGAAEATPHHWSYSGETGPDHWAAEDEAFATCGLGKAQSPIDIETTQKKELPPLEFNYQPSPLRVTDTGHSMQVDYQPGSMLTVGRARYELVQFHFHKPSEERFQGHAYSMVVHLVHKNDKGELAVVAVLLRRGQSNAFLKPIFDNFPTAGNTVSAVADRTVNATDLLPAHHGYFSFEGSLTTPPCTEHVRWFVLKTAVEVSPAQVQQFGSHYQRNARPAQPLNGRGVLESKN
jgi:carbonic anhydrase